MAMAVQGCGVFSETAVEERKGEPVAKSYAVAAAEKKISIDAYYSGSLTRVGWCFCAKKRKKKDLSLQHLWTHSSTVTCSVVH